jgi:hypothetical protein
MGTTEYKIAWYENLGVYYLDRLVGSGQDFGQDC